MKCHQKKLLVLWFAMCYNVILNIKFSLNILDYNFQNILASFILLIDISFFFGNIFDINDLLCILLKGS